MAVAARAVPALHDLQAWLHVLSHTWPRAHGPIVSRHAHDAYGRAERGRAFDRRYRAHLDGLRSVLLHVAHGRACHGCCSRERPFLLRIRPREAATHASSQHTYISRSGGQRDACKWPVHAQPAHSRLCEVYRRRTDAAEVQRSSRRSVEINCSSCRASGAWRLSTIPSAEQGFTIWDEAMRVLTRRRIAATVTAEELGLLARMFRALLRHRRGSKAGRYYRRRHDTPKVLNLEELWSSTTWSASKSSAVAEMRGELARTAVALATHGHDVGAVQRANRDNWRRDSIETILSFTPSKLVCR